MFAKHELFDLLEILIPVHNNFPRHMHFPVA